MQSWLLGRERVLSAVVLCGLLLFLARWLAAAEGAGGSGACAGCNSSRSSVQQQQGRLHV
jgi:hypothetical protein